ncbi:A/G-specific adenine glycosylase [Parachlamydia acanthamoebae]|jgi:A/G-specific adenine glycosylase|uniref:A/G-specific adenine glycosylase n=1 Tax=Parachlamydia acanthamoebae TaxID=83552 RepID=UPI0024E1D21C|nr:A/G-specific adenine glycosylase [Parachlamydia acanthamoebae]
MEFKQFDNPSLHRWFLEHKRDLPWRNTSDPYAIWVSEVMLQQTQVAVVIPYFERWMTQFPTIATLAEAPLDHVIKAWEGLGYYSRARHLHEAAQFVLLHWEGQLPDREEDLKKIKGLGPYTIGAILSFAFHQKRAAVDGNVMRVLTRYFNMADDISKPKTVQMLRQMALSILPEDAHWITNEALIELGATICKKKAECQACPLSSSCLAYRSGTVSERPVKSAKIKVEKLFRMVPIIQYEQKVLVKRGKKGEIMSDLYEFPYFEKNLESIHIQELKEIISHEFRLNVTHIFSMDAVTHGFTRFHVTLFPEFFQASSLSLVEGYQWLEMTELEKLAFSSGHRKIMNKIK